MIDIQNQIDTRNLPLDLVGITNFILPLKIRFGKTPPQTVTAKINLYTNLSETAKGTHLSRLVELLTISLENELDLEKIKKIIKQAAQKLETSIAQIEFEFMYFLKKSSPVSKREHVLGYQIKLVSNYNTGVFTSFFNITIPVMLLCPCSKAISKYNAHNQKANVTLSFNSTTDTIIQKVIKKVEKMGSAEIYALLKRPDEKYVTEVSYENPKFVEDIVRDVALHLRDYKQISNLIVECESFESIHDHNAYAKYINNS